MGNIFAIAEPSSLKHVWQTIFVSDDPFGWPFKESIDTKMIFYPTNGFHLSLKQFNALVEAACAIGESGFLISITEGQKWDPSIPSIFDAEHWWCEFPSYDEYRSLPLVLENSVYSRNGRWGILVSHEDHAVVGGPSEFIHILSEKYGDWRQDLSALREAWAGNPNSEWLNLILAAWPTQRHGT